MSQQQQLLDALDRWEQAWASKDPGALQQVLAPNATLHADGILFDHDIQGADTIAGLHKKYFDRFDYTHESHARSANPETHAAFSLWTDTGVHRRGGAEGEEGRSSAISGMWKLVFTPDGKSATDIYFLRQLHPEEAEHRLQDPGCIARSAVDHQRFSFTGSASAVAGQKQDQEDRQAATRRVAELYSKVWQTGNASIADDIMDEHIRSLDLMHGGEISGREAYKEMIVGVVHAGWEPESSSLDVGVSSDGSIGMVHWETQGKVKGKEESVSIYGLSCLVLNEQGKIKEAAGFRQFFPEEEKKYMKPDAFVHADACSKEK